MKTLILRTGGNRAGRHGTVITWAVAAALAVSLAGVTQATTAITWLAPKQISQAGDASTWGAQVDGIRAYTDNTGGNYGNYPTLTLGNGVTFYGAVAIFHGSSPVWSLVDDPIHSGGPGDIVVNTDNTPYNGGGNVGSSDPNYNSLLATLSYINNANGTITFTNLVAGHEYLVEVWANQIGAFQNGINLAGVTPIGMTASVSGGNGSFAIGTFLASGTSFVENYQNSPYAGEANDLNNNFPNYVSAVLDAVQLRDLGAIPEPSSVALLALGGLLLRLRREKP